MVCLDGVLLEYKHNINKTVEEENENDFYQMDSNEFDLFKDRNTSRNRYQMTN